MHLLDRVEQDACQPGIAHGAVVALHVRVLLRLARLDVVDPDAVAFRPAQQRTADVLRTVVAADRFRLAAPFDDLLQRPNDLMGWTPPCQDGIKVPE